MKRVPFLSKMVIKGKGFGQEGGGDSIVFKLCFVTESSLPL